MADGSTDERRERVLEALANLVHHSANRPIGGWHSTRKWERTVLAALGEGGEQVDSLLSEVRCEFKRATGKFGSFASAHEGYAVLLEEVDELWDEVRRNPKDMAAIREEALQVATMGVRFMHDVCPTPATENHETEGGDADADGSKLRGRSPRAADVTSGAEPKQDGSAPEGPIKAIWLHGDGRDMVVEVEFVNRPNEWVEVIREHSGHPEVVTVSHFVEAAGIARARKGR